MIKNSLDINNIRKMSESLLEDEEINVAALLKLLEVMLESQNVE